jgi:ElaB/YqjD/DUF883 family membrane-anchored ribosome-binding protein
MGQIQTKGGELVGRVEGQAGQMAGQMQSQASQLSTETQQRARQMTTQAQQRFQENPLAAATAAIALGATVGFLIPETPQEQQLMGPTRDTLVDKAQTAAQDTMQKMQSVAQEATGAAQQEAKEQGPSS